jgi:cytochrome c553
LNARIVAAASGGKTPEPGTMTAVAARLDEKQIEAAAAFLSQLEPWSAAAG